MLAPRYAGLMAGDGRRRSICAAGATTAMVALAGVVAALLLPVASYTRCNQAGECVSGRESILAGGIEPGVVIFTGVAAAIIALIGWGALSFGSPGPRPARTAIVAGAVMLTALAWATSFSLGIFLAPAVVAAWVTVVLAFRAPAPLRSMPR